MKHNNNLFCLGDGGGPLVAGWTSKNISSSVLVGVVSSAEGCGEPGYPTIYSRVTAVRDWIKLKSGI